MPTKEDLMQRQALPLRAKALMSQNRIREWYNHFGGNVCISFSGGKDSTVLAHLVHEIYPDVPLVFADTGLEYPEIRKFADKMGAEFVRPKMRFDEVISKYGYPLISKEVAEAIHFARRIVAKNPESLDSPERERERERESTASRRRNELHGERDDTELIRRRTGDAGLCSTDTHTHTQNLQGRTGWRRANLTGNTPLPAKEQNGTLRNENQQRSQTGLDGGNSDGFSGQGTGSWGSDGAGVADTAGNSQFNKKKWLPLCQETQFRISHYCCNVMKKGPMGKYQRKTGRVPYIGTLCEESRLRKQAWLRHGCNAFDGKKQTSQPMSFWLEQDVLHYIWENWIEICSVYGDLVAVDEDGLEYTPIPGIDCKLKCTGCQRTGCMYCAFGANHEKGETRFQRLARTHPKQYEYCMNGGQWVDNPDYDPTAPKMDGDWLNWNPKQIWVPSKKGLGMKKVFDDCNEIYGKDFIRYD